MKQIIPPNESVLRTLGKSRQSQEPYRMMTCCLPLETEDGVLLFHVLTRELLLLAPEEYAGAGQLPYLQEHWFFVPESTNDAELVSFVRWVLQNYKKDAKQSYTQGYTILTTTDCNARCFYCYENGCTHISMTPDTAHKVAGYIQEHCGGKKVTLTWFGGEPLVNHSVIDLICEDLRRTGVEYESRMVSNGYLFCGEVLSKAKDLWNLGVVQISLDGTEEIYNYSKDYIYQEGSAYQVVLSNMEAILDAGIAVKVRLNISPINTKDLLALVEELAHRFSGKENLKIYTHPLFDFSPNANEKESRKQLFAAQAELEEAILAAGLSTLTERPLRRCMKLRHCMADNGHSVLIAPDGHIGLCEHHIQDEFIGHVDRPEVDQEVVRRWQERGEEVPECKTCFYYPECTHLKGCFGSSDCSEHKRKMVRQRLEHSMLYELRRWKAQNEE